MLMHHATMTGFANERGRVSSVILPVGSLEEHGPHLPLGLDAMHAEALAAATAGLHPCWVAPTVFYGLCRSSAQHDGTVGITGPTLTNMVYELGKGFWQQKLKAMCILTGHAGGTHNCALTEAGERLLADTGLAVALVNVLDLLDQARSFLECPGDSHAGEVETSLAMHLWPELVQGTAPEEYPTFPRFRLVRNKKGHWPGGVWGDPAKASAEKGRRILNTEAQALAEVLADLESHQDA